MSSENPTLFDSDQTECDRNRQLITDCVNQEAASFRNKRFGYAIVTSVLSKVTTAILQMLAIPVAMASIGVHGYATYVALFAIASWVGLATIVPGPSLVVRMASSVCESRQSQIHASAFWPVAVNLLFIAGIGTSMVLLLPVEHWFDSNDIPFSIDSRRALFLLFTIQILEGFFKVVESLQAAFQEIHILNLRGVVGNVLTIVALLLVSPFYKNLTGFVVALYFPQLATRFFNAAFFFYRYPHLIPHPTFFNWSESRSLFADGVAYTFATNASTYLLNQLPLLLLATVFLRTEEAALISVSFTLLFSFFGAVSMLCAPLWAAIADSVRHRDYKWTSRTYGRIIKICMVYASSCAIILSFAGPKIYQLWLGKEVSVDSIFCLSMAIYFCLLVWEYVHFMILVGLGNIRIPPILFLARGVISCVLFYTLALINLEYYLFFAYSIATLLATGIPLPTLTRINILRKQNEATVD